MAATKHTAAEAQSPSLETVIKAALPEVSVTVDPSAALASERRFSDLFGQMLDYIAHLRLVDQHFEETFSTLPDEVQSAATVLHRATAELDALHTAMDGWSVHHVHTPKPRTESAGSAEDGAQAAEAHAHAPQLPQALADYIFDQQVRAEELQSVLEMIYRAEECTGAMAVAVRLAKELNEALDILALRKALEAPQS